MKYIKRFFSYGILFLLSSPVLADFAVNSPSGFSGSPDVTASLLKVTGGLLLVLIAIFGSAWAYKRFGNMTPISTDSLKVIGGVSMGQKERVVLMQVGDEQILLGVSPGRIECLHVLAKNIAVKEGSSDKTTSFAAQLSTALKQKNHG